MSGTEATSSLVERDDELRRLAASVEAAVAGTGAVVWIEGPPGIGKTTLLDRLQELALASGMTVLSATGGELEREFPFGVVRQLFEPALAAASAEERQALLAGPAELAAPLVDGAPAALPFADASYPVLHGIFWLFSNLAARGPVAVVVDDAQWVDPPSLRALAYIARRAAGVQAAIALAARTGEAAADAAAVRAAAREASALLRPRPLSPSAAAAIAHSELETEVAPAFAQALHETTGGNPFLVRALLGGVAADGWTPDDANADRVRRLSPEAVTRAALGRLVALGPAATALAQAVAVLGNQAGLRYAASLAGLDEEEAAAAADALAEADLLRRERPLDFTHPIVRRCIYDDLPPSVRARMHGRAARELDAGAEAVAAHLLAADPGGDAWSVTQLETAAHQALAQGAPDAAIRFLERALAEPPAAADRGRILGALGAAEARVPAHRGRAIDHLREAAGLAGDPLQRLLHEVELGQALLLAGRVEEAVGVLDGALQALDPAFAEVGLVLQGALLMASYASPAARRGVAGRRWRFQGGDGPPASAGDRVWLATSALERSFAGANAAEARDLALRALDDGRLIAEQGSDSPIFYLAANTLMYVDALDDALAAFDAAIGDARRRGSLRGFAMASCWRAGTQYWRGALGPATADARTALETAGDADLALGVPMAGAFLVLALTDSGDLDDAEQALADGGSAGATAGDSMGVDLLLHAAGRLRLAQGRPEEALEHLLASGRRQREWGIAAPVIPWRADAVRALAALDRAAEAEHLAADAIAEARRSGAARHLGLALHAAATVAAGPGERLALLEEAETVLAAGPARLVHASALVELGATLRRTGRRADAREPLRRGLEIARGCGAYPLASRAFDELEASGVRQRRILRSGVEALTSSERRIADLAVSGMTNREIAAALFVTVRTVEAHLGHAYRKLGITGRGDLSRALAGSADDAPPVR